MRITPLSVVARTVFAAVVVLAVVCSGVGGNAVQPVRDIPMSPVAQPSKDDEIALAEADAKGGSGRGAASGAAVGDAIYNLINADSPGERAKQLVASYADAPRFAGFSVIAIQQETYSRSPDISGIQYVNVGNTFGTSDNKWDVYIFQSGTFTNTGDLGFENWVWVGYVASRSDDGRTVTFDSPGAGAAGGVIDGSADPEVDGPEAVPDTWLGDDPVQEWVTKYAESEKYSGYSVIALQQETYGEPQDLKGVRYKKKDINLGTAGGNKWDFYVFKSGTFENTGDLGANNWFWVGFVASRSEDGHTVTFDSPGQKEADPGSPPGPAPLRDSYIVRSARELVQDLVNQYAESDKYSGYSVIMIQQETYDGPQDIKDIQYEKKGVNIGETEGSMDDNKWDFFVFKSGVFKNTGDLGSNNWFWNGFVVSRSDDERTLTFDSPGQPPPPEPPEPPAGDPDAVLRLMPLGSSSTAGDGSSTGNGYRDYLRTKAFKAGRPDDLVGSNVAGTMSDRDNEGWPGFEIDLIAGKAKCAVRTYQPNVITLLAGANDVNNNHDGAPARLEALIRQVISDDAGVTVLVGGIQPLITSPAATLRAATYNTAQRDLVSKLAAEGLKVGWAPNDVTTGDIREDDKIHPGDRGYEKIATGYATALATARDKLWLTAPNPQAADVGSHPCGSQDWGNGDGNGGNGTGGNQGVVDRRWEDHGVSFAAGFGKGNAYRWGDVNKDGKPELFVVRPDQSWTFYWNGGRTDKGWTGWAKGISRPAATRGLVGNRLRIADIDGDGEPDCLQVGSNGLVDAYLWDASKPVGQKLCGKASKQQHDVPKTGAIAADTQIVFADVNGDGRDDYLLVQPRGTTRLWLNGQKPDPKKAGTSVFAWTPVGQITGALPDPRVRRWADVNGDGRADQILLTAKGGARAWINDGLTKDTSGRVTGVRLRDIGEIAKDKNVPPNDVQFVDVGGNGRADFVRVGWTGVTHIWLNRLNADDLR